MKSGRVPHVLFRVSRISPDFRKTDCDFEERAVNLSEKEGREKQGGCRAKCVWSLSWHIERKENVLGSGGDSFQTA